MSIEVNKDVFYTYETIAVANYILESAETNGISLDSVTLQAILYYAHGLYLLYTDTPLIAEPIQAWEYGPGIPSLHSEFLEFDGIGINRFAHGHEGIVKSFDKENEYDFILTIPAEDTLACEIIDMALFMILSEPYLLEMIYEPHSPWSIARQSTKIMFNPPIDNLSIIEDIKIMLDSMLNADQLYPKAKIHPKKRPKRQRKSRRKR